MSRTLKHRLPWNWKHVPHTSIPLPSLAAAPKAFFLSMHALAHSYIRWPPTASPSKKKLKHNQKYISQRSKRIRASVFEQEPFAILSHKRIRASLLSEPLLLISYCSLFHIILPSLLENPWRNSQDRGNDPRGSGRGSNVPPWGANHFKKPSTNQMHTI